MLALYFHGEVYSIQHYAILFVSDLRQVGGFLQVLWFPPPKITDHHDITEILLKVALNTINQTNQPIILFTRLNQITTVIRVA